MATAIRSEELDPVVRALSHDMSANFMLLQNSIAHLKKSLGDADDDRPLQGGDAADEWLPEDMQAYMAHVDACLQESKRLLDDLARLARTGTVEMEPRRVELAPMVDQVLFEQHDLLQQRGIEVTVDRPLPAVWCNEGRLKQIVTNLIRNAACHGCDPISPRITIGPARPRAIAGAHSPGAVARTNPAGDAGMVAFRIHDNGPGIDPRFREEVFLPGRRLANSRAEGSGMGLAIVKDLVDHYGGAVYIDPACRQGTALVVSLPAAAASNHAASTGSANPPAHHYPRQLQSDGRHTAGHGQLHRRFSPQSRGLGG